MNTLQNLVPFPRGDPKGIFLPAKEGCKWDSEGRLLFLKPWAQNCRGSICRLVSTELSAPSSALGAYKALNRVLTSQELAVLLGVKITHKGSVNKYRALEGENGYAFVWGPGFTPRSLPWGAERPGVVREGFLEEASV